MLRNILIGCGALSILGVLVLVVLLLVGGALIVGSDVGKQAVEEAAEGESGTVTIRVSGTQGTPFTGSYGTTRGGQRTVEGTIGAQPTDYNVPVETSPLEFDNVSASFQKRTQRGQLRVEILADGEVKKSQETTADFGVVSVTYSPQTD
ncbi:MAG TPA: hypothetical protein VFE09_06575 [Rubrobacteraceae bacterium]|nr:hypothetical protein [Rubrobacteraceae bacterium]